MSISIYYDKRFGRAFYKCKLCCPAHRRSDGKMLGFLGVRIIYGVRCHEY